MWKIVKQVIAHLVRRPSAGLRCCSCCTQLSTGMLEHKRKGSTDSSTSNTGHEYSCFSSQSFQTLISLNQDFTKKPELLKMAMIKHIPWRRVPCIFGRYMGDFNFPSGDHTHLTTAAVQELNEICSFYC